MSTDNRNNLSVGKNLNPTKSVCISNASLVEEKSYLQSLVESRVGPYIPSLPQPTWSTEKAKTLWNNWNRCYISWKNSDSPGCMTLISHCIKMLYSHRIISEDTVEGKASIGSTSHASSQSGWRATLVQSTHAGIKNDRPRVPYSIQ